MRILAISGSLRAGSYNTALARAAAERRSGGRRGRDLRRARRASALRRRPRGGRASGRATPARDASRTPTRSSSSRRSTTARSRASSRTPSTGLRARATTPHSGTRRWQSQARARASTALFGRSRTSGACSGSPARGSSAPSSRSGGLRTSATEQAARARSSSSGSGPTSRSCSGSRADACRCLIGLAACLSRTLRGSRPQRSPRSGTPRERIPDLRIKKGRVSAALLERIPALDLVEALPARCEHPAARIASPLRWLGVSRWSRGHTSTRWYLHCPYCHHSSRTTSFPR